MHQLDTRAAGGGVPTDTPTLKSVEVRNGGLEVREILSWGLRGVLFI
jgi:hypothetical protein